MLHVSLCDVDFNDNASTLLSLVIHVRPAGADDVIITPGVARASRLQLVTPNVPVLQASSHTVLKDPETSCPRRFPEGDFFERARKVLVYHTEYPHNRQRFPWGAPAHLGL